MSEEKLEFEEIDKLPKFVAKYIENSTGDEDVIYGFCVKKDGILYDVETHRPLLQYVGEKVLYEWELSEEQNTSQSSEAVSEELKNKLIESVHKKLQSKRSKHGNLTLWKLAEIAVEESLNKITNEKDQQNEK